MFHCFCIQNQNTHFQYTKTHHTARLSDVLLHVAIGRFIGMISQGAIFAEIDATGFENRPANTITILTDAISGMYLQKCQQDLI